MRWASLFEDLTGQLEAADAAAHRDEVADRTRRELARLRLVDRLRAHHGVEVELGVVGQQHVAGTIAGTGPDWLLLEATGTELLVPLAAVTSVRGLPLASTEPGAAGAVADRLGLAHALRSIARDRSPVRLTLVDATVLTGTIDRVGADSVDLAGHGPGEPRRSAAVSSVRTVPFHAVAVVRST